MADVVLLSTGGSNYTSLQSAFERLGARCQISTDVDVIATASHVVLPGVGSSSSAMHAIEQQGLAPLIKSLKQPLLGICLGMQVLYRFSDESEQACLGIFPGNISRLANAPSIRVPHMGWNSVHSTRANPLFKGIDGADFYFVHSYAAALDENSIAQSTHGQIFTAAVAAENVYGVQFHPERSGPQGQTLLENFLGISS
jgi:imidazole glycerol-phosphate synthase subunit HisH